MLRDRIIPAVTAVGVAAVSVFTLYHAVTRVDGSLSMVLGLAGVLLLAGSTLTLVSVSLK